MNSPEYILVDEIANCVTQMNSSLATMLTANNLTSINYQYGFKEELNETLMQMSNSPAQRILKFPCVYFLEPYNLKRGDGRFFYGNTTDMRLILIMESDPTWKAAERRAKVYNPILLPMYREILKQIANNPAFAINDENQIPHNVVMHYYWGEGNKSVLNDIVDCIDISNITMDIYNNQNCTPFKNF